MNADGWTKHEQATAQIVHCTVVRNTTNNTPDEVDKKYITTFSLSLAATPTKGRFGFN